MSKTMNINGIDFEIISSSTKKGMDIIRTFNSVWLKNWYDLYKSPSREKVEIMQQWEKFFDEISADFSKYAGNTSTFSIYNKSNDGYFYITKSHNYIVIWHNQAVFGAFSAKPKKSTKHYKPFNHFRRLILWKLKQQIKRYTQLIWTF